MCGSAKLVATNYHLLYVAYEHFYLIYKSLFTILFQIKPSLQCLESNLKQYELANKVTMHCKIIVYKKIYVVRITQTASNLMYLSSSALNIFQVNPELLD